MVLDAQFQLSFSSLLHVLHLLLQCLIRKGEGLPGPNGAYSTKTPAQVDTRYTPGTH